MFTDACTSSRPTSRHAVGMWCFFIFATRWESNTVPLVLFILVPSRMLRPRILDPTPRDSLLNVAAPCLFVTANLAKSFSARYTVQFGPEAGRANMPSSTIGMSRSSTVARRPGRGTRRRYACHSPPHAHAPESSSPHGREASLSAVIIFSSLRAVYVV